jgi:hypothetical protein
MNIGQIEKDGVMHTYPPKEVIPLGYFGWNNGHSIVDGHVLINMYP